MVLAGSHLQKYTAILSFLSQQEIIADPTECHIYIYFFLYLKDVQVQPVPHFKILPHAEVTAPPTRDTNYLQCGKNKPIS